MKPTPAQVYRQVKAMLAASQDECNPDIARQVLEQAQAEEEKRDCLMCSSIVMAVADETHPAGQAEAMARDANEANT